MKLLLDSHILLWTVFEPDRLSSSLRNAIADPENLVSVSIASIWEIAIKEGIGRITLPNDFYKMVLKDSGFDTLLIQPSHINEYRRLPLLHRDPFDRMLIAQARVEKYTLATGDEAIKQYDIDVF